MVYAGKRRPVSRKKKKISGSDKLLNKLTVCLWVLFLAVLMRVVFPETTMKVKDAFLDIVGGNIDYVSAFKALGEAANGENGLFRAISDAITHAFNIGGEGQDIEVSADGEDISDEELFYNEPTHEDGSNSNNDTDKADECEVFAGGNNDEAYEDVSADMDESSEFLNLDLPVNTTLDKLELTIGAVLPVKGTVTSGFGYREHPSDGQVRFHYGTDIGAKEGSTVCSFSGGKVTAIGESASYGKYIMIDHGENVGTLYAHLSSISVTGGAEVAVGQEIGKVGSSGNASGNCLHFELTIGGVYVDPEHYVKWE